jgi:glycogen synthase
VSETGALDVCIVASEALPYSKSGGLADVTGSLPRALADLGCRVTLIHPLYRNVRDRFPGLQEEPGEISVDLGGDATRVRIFRHRLSPGITSFLVDHFSSIIPLLSTAPNSTATRGETITTTGGASLSSAAPPRPFSRRHLPLPT